MKEKQQLIPLSSHDVQAGFPSPADDFLESGLDLHEYLIRHESATFMVRVSGESMLEAGILPGDILLVDRSEAWDANHIVIAVVDGDLTVKRLVRGPQGWFLQAENQRWKPIQVMDCSELEIWGVVVGVVRKL